VNAFASYGYSVPVSPRTRTAGTNVDRLRIQAADTDTCVGEAIDQLFKRMRSSRSARPQSPNPTSGQYSQGPVPNPRRPPPPPHGRRTGTTGEWPPATRGSPPAPAKGGPGLGPPPRGRV